MCSLTVGNCFAAHLLRREYPVLFKIYIRILTFLSNIIDQIGRLLMWRPRPEGVKNLTTGGKSRFSSIFTAAASSQETRAYADTTAMSTHGGAMPQ